MYIQFNPNPKGEFVGDCVIRAISKLLNMSWEETYIHLCVQGYKMGDMPSSNSVWSAYLQENGCSKEIIPNSCPNCYSVKDFCEDNPQGSFLLATGSHVVTVIDGNYYDSWDSGKEVPVFLFRKG